MTRSGVMRIGAKARFLVVGVSLIGSCMFGSHTALAVTKHRTAHSSVHVASRRTRLHAVTQHTELASTHHRVRTSHQYTSVRHESVALRNRHLEHYGSKTQASSYRVHHVRYAQYRHSGLQCVPYAREVSHIELSGNAFLWWAEAAGRYQRGNVPQEGAVLNFRAIGRMPLGHVAVVTSVVDSRTILVTQANWVRGTITNDVTMQDVSPNNDWTEVQVELGDSRTWGAAYPTYGFIYNEPATGTVIASTAQRNEVAEAPAVAPISTDAPDRNLQ